MWRLLLYKRILVSCKAQSHGLHTNTLNPCHNTHKRPIVISTHTCKHLHSSCLLPTQETQHKIFSITSKNICLWHGLDFQIYFVCLDFQIYFVCNFLKLHNAYSSCASPMWKKATYIIDKCKELETSSNCIYQFLWTKKKSSLTFFSILLCCRMSSPIAIFRLAIVHFLEYSSAFYWVVGRGYIVGTTPCIEKGHSRV